MSTLYSLIEAATQINTRDLAYAAMSALYTLIEAAAHINTHDLAYAAMSALYTLIEAAAHINTHDLAYGAMIVFLTLKGVHHLTKRQHGEAGEYCLMAVLNLLLAVAPG